MCAYAAHDVHVQEPIKESWHSAANQALSDIPACTLPASQGLIAFPGLDAGRALQQRAAALFRGRQLRGGRLLLGLDLRRRRLVGFRVFPHACTLAASPRPRRDLRALQRMQHTVCTVASCGRPGQGARAPARRRRCGRSAGTARASSSRWPRTRRRTPTAGSCCASPCSSSRRPGAAGAPPRRLAACCQSRHPSAACAPALRRERARPPGSAASTSPATAITASILLSS